MNTYYTISEQDIQHHGILGMKWGIRRYQPYPKDYHGSGKEVGQATRVVPRSARGYKKQLSRLNRKANANVGQIKSYQAKERWAKRLDMQKKDYSKEINEHKKILKEIESSTWKTVAEAIENGYDIKMTETTQLANARGVGLAWLAGGAYLAAPLSLANHVLTKDAFDGQSSEFVRGQKYKVSKSKTGQGSLQQFRK